MSQSLSVKIRVELNYWGARKRIMYRYGCRPRAASRTGNDKVTWRTNVANTGNTAATKPHTFFYLIL